MVANMLSAGLGTVGNLAGGFVSNAHNRASQWRAFNMQRFLQQQQAELNYNYSMQSARNLPTAQRTGLENAGYNPLLALGGFNSSTSFAGTGSAAMTPGSDFSGLGRAGDSVRESYKVFHQQQRLNEKTIDHMDSQIDNTNANTFLAEQQAETEQQKRNLMFTQEALNNIEYQLKHKDLEWYERRQLTELETMLRNSNSMMIGAQAQMNNAATAEKLFNLNDQLEAGNKVKAKIDKEFYDSKFGKGLRKYGQFSSEVVPSVGALFGLGAGATVAGRALSGMFKRPVGFSTR